MNQKAMMQMALSFTQVKLMNKLNIKKHRDKDCPTGKAHRVMPPLIRKFEPEDTMAEMKMEQALAKMKLGPKKDPSKLLNKLASIECKYSLELSNSKKNAQVLRLGGSLYSSIIATMNMIYCKKSKTLTCEALIEEMHIQWRLSGVKGKDNKDSDDDKEVTLVATIKKGGKAAGNKKGNNSNANITCMWKQTVGGNTQTRFQRK
jgi:hypothetical protein